MLTRLRLASVVAVALLGPAGGVGAAGGDTPDPPRLPGTLVTEGALPATELEAGVSLTKSREGRGVGVGITSAQWAPVSWLGVKLVVPFAVLERSEAPTVAGIGDVSVAVKYAALTLPERQLAVAGGLRLGFPTGSAERGLGGMYSAAPFVLAGKALDLGDLGRASVQVDGSYTWQLDQPRRPEADPSAAERPSRPDRAQIVAANVTAAWTTPIEVLNLLLELNHVTVVDGDPALRQRPQLYVTPGLAVERTGRWSIRAGIQLPITRARSFDYAILLFATRGF